tara:strand:- start:643 stop:819 length:177 start_codon:yes stop_codon:yes gene_type:complete
MPHNFPLKNHCTATVLTIQIRMILMSIAELVTVAGHPPYMEVQPPVGGVDELYPSPLL